MTQNLIINRLSKDTCWTEQDLGGKRPNKSVCIVRYGGYGDMIQIAPVFKYFKDQGYYVTVNCHSDTSFDIVHNNPNIDEVFLQDRDQVKQVNVGGFNDLQRYWFNLSLLFDRFINLSESVEGSLFAISGRAPYEWPKRARHMYMNHNYFDMTEAICDIESGEIDRNDLRGFYPTDVERYKAQRFINRIKTKNPNAKIVLWSLSGSALHKATPWTDQVLANFMLHAPDVHFILTGDKFCKILEQGWEKESRVHLRSGSDIRDTLSLIEYVDCVVGPETGVTNCSGQLGIPTILFCSHSNPNKVAKYWKNKVCLEPENLPCYPCHILFQKDKDSKVCKRDEETGATMCTYLIHADIIRDAILEVLSSD